MPASRTTFACLLHACLLLPAAATAKVVDYAIDPVHSRIAFQVDHAGFSRVIGTFSGISGRLAFDPDDWSSARVEATIPLATLDLGDRNWNGKILDRTFLDAATRPQARFVSTRVTPLETGQLRIEGQLELHGQRQPVTLEARINAIKRHPLTLRRTAGFSARATISRKAFGVDAWSTLVGDEVALTLEIEAQRQRSTDTNGGDTDDAPDHEPQ